MACDQLKRLFSKSAMMIRQQIRKVSRGRRKAHLLKPKISTTEVHVILSSNGESRNHDHFFEISPKTMIAKKNENTKPEFTWNMQSILFS